MYYVTATYYVTASKVTNLFLSCVFNEGHSHDAQQIIIQLNYSFGRQGQGHADLNAFELTRCLVLGFNDGSILIKFVFFFLTEMCTT